MLGLGLQHMDLEGGHKLSVHNNAGSFHSSSLSFRADERKMLIWVFKMEAIYIMNSWVTGLYT